MCHTVSKIKQICMPLKKVDRTVDAAVEHSFSYGNNFATSVNVLLEHVNTVSMDFIDIHNTFRMFVCIDT